VLRERIRLNSPVIRKETALVNQVVSDGKARYRGQSDVRVLNVMRVVPRREIFVPDVDEDFLF